MSSKQKATMRVVVYRPGASGFVVETVEDLSLPPYAEYVQILPKVEAILGGSVIFKDAPGNSKLAVWFRDDNPYGRVHPSVLGLVGNVVIVPFKGDGFRSVTDSDVAAIARLVRNGRRYDEPVRS